MKKEFLTFGQVYLAPAAEVVSMDMSTVIARSGEVDSEDPDGWVPGEIDWLG